MSFVKQKQTSTTFVKNRAKNRAIDDVGVSTGDDVGWMSYDDVGIELNLDEYTRIKPASTTFVKGKQAS